MKSIIEVTYEICRRDRDGIKRTGWTREGKAVRNRYGRWCVSHNGKWKRLHHAGGNWCVYV